MRFCTKFRAEYARKRWPFWSKAGACRPGGVLFLCPRPGGLFFNEIPRLSFASCSKAAELGRSSSSPSSLAVPSGAFPIFTRAGRLLNE